MERTPLVQPAFNVRLPQGEAAVRALDRRPVNGGGVERVRTSWADVVAHTGIPELFKVIAPDTWEMFCGAKGLKLVRGRMLTFFYSSEGSEPQKTYKYKHLRLRHLSAGDDDYIRLFSFAVTDDHSAASKLRCVVQKIWA